MHMSMQSTWGTCMCSRELKVFGFSHFHINNYRANMPYIHVYVYLKEH